MDLYAEFKTEAEAASEVCQALAARGYVTAEGGNLALRLRDGLILITPTRLNKGLVRACDMVFIDSEGKVVQGERKPTGETPLYLTLFRERPDIQSILHAHPPAICAVAASDRSDLLCRPYFPETIIDCGPAPSVPYAEPLTRELAEAFLPFLDRYNSFIMQNHGALIVTRGDLAEAYGKLDLLEGTADSLLRSLAAGLGLREIPREEVRNLEKTMRTRGIPFTGRTGVVQGLEELYY